jgi:hypothetical protein
MGVFEGLLSIGNGCGFVSEHLLYTNYISNLHFAACLPSGKTGFSCRMERIFELESVLQAVHKQKTLPNRPLARVRSLHLTQDSTRGTFLKHRLHCGPNSVVRQSGGLGGQGDCKVDRLLAIGAPEAQEAVEKTGYFPKTEIFLKRLLQLRCHDSRAIVATPLTLHSFCLGGRHCRKSRHISSDMS